MPPDGVSKIVSSPLETIKSVEIFVFVLFTGTTTSGGQVSTVLMNVLLNYYDGSACNQVSVGNPRNFTTQICAGWAAFFCDLLGRSFCKSNIDFNQTVCFCLISRSSSRRQGHVSGWLRRCYLRHGHNGCCQTNDRCWHRVVWRRVCSYQQTGVKYYNSSLKNMRDYSKVLFAISSIRLDSILESVLIWDG